jgi:hypothetical protein
MGKVQAQSSHPPTLEWNNDSSFSLSIYLLPGSIKRVKTPFLCIAADSSCTTAGLEKPFGVGSSALGMPHRELILLDVTNLEGSITCWKMALLAGATLLLKANPPCLYRQVCLLLGSF